MSKELAIIDLIAQQTEQQQALSDDAFWDAETRLIYTTDMLVEGQHFSLAYFSPYDVGWKAAAVNISDIAGMGGQLLHVLVSLGLPDNIDLDWIRAFYQGMLQACQAFGGRIVGGDTVKSPTLTINVTAVGQCPVGHTPGHRYTAEAGDWIVTTGYHGLSQVGLQALQNTIPGYEACKAAHLHPMPNIDAGLVLSKTFQRYALMDSSDGLADALLKIAQASGKRLVIEQEPLPIHPEVAAYYATNPEALWQAILYGGEDFELVATVPKIANEPLNKELLKHFHVIGRVEEADSQPPGAWLVEAKSGQMRPLNLAATYQHFGRSHV
jgi:thiamine-monophosphate kinase